MSKLNPDKLSVEFRDGVTKTEPIIPRRYTLTHSDITAELFLTIGSEYAKDKITAMRDEVLGEWVKEEAEYFYSVYLHVDGQLGAGTTAIRNYVFRRELPLALEAIRYGDMAFFIAHPELDNSKIIVHFMSIDPKFNKVETWGTFSDYKLRNVNRTPKTCASHIDRYLIQMEVGDVTGDGIPDKVSLYGSKIKGSSDIFFANIIVVIEYGQNRETKVISPKFNSGYNPRLFLGDFTKNKIDDIKISIDSGGSGGYGFFYIYSYIDTDFQEIFNFDKYNKEYKFKVDYTDNYKVEVGNVALNKLFVLDISYKGYDYLSKYYTENGKLKRPLQGEVLAISALVPFVNNEKLNGYDLAAVQRIIGTTNSDTLGFIQNLLTWDGQKFVSSRMFAAIPGTNLISLY
jgi:hypothetical protein